jgi:hypothetical protein
LKSAEVLRAELLEKETFEYRGQGQCAYGEAADVSSWLELGVVGDTGLDCIKECKLQGFYEASFQYNAGDHPD